MGLLIDIVSIRSMTSERVIINNIYLGLGVLNKLKVSIFSFVLFKDLNRILNSSFEVEI